MIELPIVRRVSECTSLKLRVWKEYITLTISLNKDANFPKGSFFFLDQSEGLCGAKRKLNSLKCQSTLKSVVVHFNNLSHLKDRYCHTCFCRMILTNFKMIYHEWITTTIVSLKQKQKLFGRSRRIPEKWVSFL